MPSMTSKDLPECEKRLGTPTRTVKKAAGQKPRRGHTLLR